MERITTDVSCVNVNSGYDCSQRKHSRTDRLATLVLFGDWKKSKRLKERLTIGGHPWGFSLWCWRTAARRKWSLPVPTSGPSSRSCRRPRPRPASAHIRRMIWNKWGDSTFSWNIIHRVSLYRVHLTKCIGQTWRSNPTLVENYMPCTQYLFIFL